MSREPWRPIFKNFRQQLIGKRIIAILFLCLWSGILGSWYIVIHRYANNFTEMCERINYDDNVVVETIQYNPGLSDWGRRFDGYRLVEYLLNGKGRQQQTDEEVMADRDAYDEIPILFVPDGEDAADAQQFLAKLLRDRTRGEKFRYRFFSIDFGNQLAFINGLHMDMMHQYVTRATVWIMNRYSHKRVVLIGHGTGGTAAHSTSTLFEWRYYEKMNLNVTDIMIFMAAPLGHPGFVQDRKTEKFYELNRNRWLEKRDFAQVGHLSISAGFADGQVTEEWTQFLDMINVPAWSIQDVPDVGTKAGGILVCKPILNHIADLLIEYGRQTNVKMGKQILNEFYADYWKQKETKLPLDWRNDTLDGALTMTTGGQYEFIMHDKQWLTVKLARGEFIVVTIYGSCCESGF
uniref:Post-GPI attachment to proteins factor 1 n=1 Tax=Caenorhabditis japonica TaxID=281687 RepID=A0A8R1HW75_CAEJA